MSASQRIQWIDASKGIGIFLVIIGHTMIAGNLRWQIFAFHMPLFFFLSGYLFSIKKYQRFNEFLIAKCKSLLVPYISFAIFAIILNKILLHQEINIREFLVALIASRRNNIFFDEPLWFLTSLFTMEVIYYFLTKYIKNQSYNMIIVIVLSYFAISNLNVQLGSNILPWSFDQTLYFIFYFGLGQFIKNNAVPRNDLKKSYLLISSSIVYIVLLAFPTIYPNIFNFLNTYLYLPLNLSNFISTVIWALFGISFVIYISQYLSVISFLNFWGRNSLIFLALHIPLGFNIFGKVAIERLHLKIDNPNLLGLAFTLGAIALLIPTSMLIDRYFPYILGKGLLIANRNDIKKSN